MTKLIDSDALGELNRSLGLTGRGSQITELMDGVVDQVVDINPAARRGRTLGPTSGIFTPTMRNVHTDAETLSTTVDPYSVGTTGAVAPYPPIMPVQFDIWLIGASVRVASGSGTLLATLSIIQGTTQQGFGLTDSGAQVLVSQAIRLAFWNATATVVTSFGVLNTNNGPHWRGPIRLNRNGGTIVFSSVSSLTATFDCQLILGVFPAGLGQDILG